MSALRIRSQVIISRNHFNFCLLRPFRVPYDEQPLPADTWKGPVFDACVRASYAFCPQRTRKVIVSERAREKLTPYECETLDALQASGLLDNHVLPDTTNLRMLTTSTPWLMRRTACR